MIRSIKEELIRVIKFLPSEKYPSTCIRVLREMTKVIPIIEYREFNHFPQTENVFHLPIGIIGELKIL